MPPKQIKKQVEKSTEKHIEPIVNDPKIEIELLQKEWAENVKEIISIQDKLSQLNKKNNELVSKLCEIMNKNPVDAIVIEAKQPVKSDETDDETETKKVKVTKPVSAKVTKTVTKPDIEEDKKTKKIVKKDEPVEDKPSKKIVKKEEPKVTVTKTKGKITAPAKGTVKPKNNDSEDEKPKHVIDDSSSDTEVDSLSSVSSESDASGGEDD